MGDVTTISDTIQEFNGERFYLCGHYFQHKGKRLHRAVWESYNGDIPEGYHVHHIDGDRTHNDIDNLSLMPGLEHIGMHAKEESRRANGRRAILFAIAAAPEWHRSEEGRAWHSQHSKDVWKDRPEREYVCTCCGKTFLSTRVQHNGKMFCSANCRSQYRRITGVDDEVRICPVCGRSFTVNRYAKKKTCSKACGKIARWGH